MPEWRKRKHGTPRQIGQAFPLEGESQQKKKSALAKVWGNLSGGDRSARTKKFVAAMQELLKPKEERLMESDILNPEEVKFLVQKGLLSIDDDEEIQLTAKGIKYLADRRAKKHPEEYVIREGEEPHVKSLTEKEREWMRREDETED